MTNVVNSTANLLKPPNIPHINVATKRYDSTDLQQDNEAYVINSDNAAG